MHHLYCLNFHFSFYCCSVTQLCLTLCNPMDCSAPGFPVLHHRSDLARTHIHRVSDAIQPPCLLSSPFPPAFNLSQHQGLFQRVSSPQNSWPKYWSFSFSINPSNEYSGLISFRMDWLDLLAGRSLDILMRSLDLLSLSLRVFSGTTVQKHQVFDSSTLSFLYSPTLTSVHDSCKNHRLDYTHHYQQNNVFAF